MKIPLPLAAVPNGNEPVKFYAFEEPFYYVL